GDQLRPGEAEQVVVALEVARLAATAGAMRVAFGEAQVVVTGGETVAAVSRFVQAMPLDHRAHGAVQHQDALGQGPKQGFGPGRILPGQGAHGLRASRLTSSKWGGRFSRVTGSQTSTSRPAFSAKRRSSRGVKPRLTCP